MRRSLVVLAMLALAVPATAQEKNGVFVAHAVARDVAVRLTGSFGVLRIVGWQHDSLSLSGVMQKGFTLAQPIFSGDPGVLPRGAKLYIEAPDGIYPKMVQLELRVPVGARISVKGGTSSLTVTGITGELDLTMIGGTITVDGSPRRLAVDAMDATVNVTGDAEWVRLKSDAGEITMRGKSMDAAFATTSGNVRVIDANLDRATFESTTGNLTFAGDLARGASVRFNTHSGTIDMLFATRPDVVIEAVTLAGMIENTLTSKAPSVGRTGRGQQIEFEVGLGYGRVTAETYKGNVRVSRK